VPKTLVFTNQKGKKMMIPVKRFNFGVVSGHKNEFLEPFPSKNCKIGDWIGNAMTRWVNTDDQIDINRIYGGDQIGPVLKCDQIEWRKWLEKETNLVTYDPIG
jgi:hypothetical protein